VWSYTSTPPIRLPNFTLLFSFPKTKCCNIHKRFPTETCSISLNNSLTQIYFRCTFMESHKRLQSKQQQQLSRLAQWLAYASHSRGPRSECSPEADNLTKALRGFLQFLQTNARIVPYSWLRPLPSTFSPIPRHITKGKGKVVPVLNYARHEDVLVSGGIAPRILDLGTRWR
jgi:hypothetical protein